MSSETLGSQPLVSVIIPTFNRRDLVIRAIESALNQTYAHREILVMDDGSTDDTADAVRPYLDRVTYLTQANRGLAAARNAAIRHSRGELLALLDSDDVWTPDKLEKCVRYLQQHSECDVVYTPMATMDVDGQLMAGHDKVCKEGWILDELFENICIHDPAAVFHRRVWERVGGFDESLPVCVGHNFWLRVAVAHRIGLINEPLAIRTWMKDSLTRGRKARVFRIKAEMLHRFFAEQGGADRLDHERARRALAKTCWTAGRLAMREGAWNYAARMFRGAVHYRRTMPSRLLFAYTDWQRRRHGLPAIETRDAA